jgi:hypothetical protein
MLMRISAALPTPVSPHTEGDVEKSEALAISIPRTEAGGDPTLPGADALPEFPKSR